MAGKRKSPASPPRPSKTLDGMARRVGCRLVSIGDVEQLAGVDIRSAVERSALWNRFGHLFSGPTQILFDAVMDHCAVIAIGRIQAGELCLVKTKYC